ncbi:hypothetical protein AGMMS49983_12520 [Clostridia bacterium]|nr:hypothetical protein AGMMS49983_12520 [Clostridia bacterium]
MANNYAFIDSQNLNLGVRSLGWKLDYRKFRLYLKNKYNVSNAFMFIGYVEGNQELYTLLQKSGFILVYKNTVSHIENGKTIIKGNVDAELVLHAAAIEYPKYDKAVIVTNDGDFTCLIKYLQEHERLLRILTPNSKFSSLFKPYIKSITTMNKLRGVVEKNDRQGGRSKP